MASSRAAHRSDTWKALFQRFAEFQAMPCIVGTGPGMKRPSETATYSRLQRRFVRDRKLLPARPSDLTQSHIDRILGSGPTGTTKRRTRPNQQSLWNGLWRAIILDRDDYRCDFCKRSGEEGIVVEGEGRLALRLELDHIIPRSSGGRDYLLTNIRTLCRTCNLTRGRLKDAYFQAELRSLAAALAPRRRSGSLSAV